jgi:hypothetical protein
MLVKEDVIYICNSLNFNPDEYCLGFGGALVLYGIKGSTVDIDINVTNALFKRLSQIYKVDHAMFNEPYIRIDGVVDVFIGSNMDSKTYIEGIPVSTLQEIIESKRRLGRPKDIEDIRCIEEFISNNKLQDSHL